MRKALPYTALAASLVLMAGCNFENLGDWGGSGRFTQDFHYSYPLKPGGRLSLENFNGSVEITGWDENTVEVSGIKFAPSLELRDAIRINASVSPDSVYIRTERPSAWGSIGAKYYVKVPRKTQLERILTTNGAIRVLDAAAARLETTNGSVRAQKVDGDLDARTTNGSIEAADVAGNCVLRTSNGAVEVTLNAPPHGDLRARTTNGRITLHLPAKTNARLLASTTSASIRTEFDVQPTGDSDRRHLDTVIGAGGPTIEVSTTNGAIRILKTL
jgi:hypothetical protein